MTDEKNNPKPLPKGEKVHAGVESVPPWDVGELPPAPPFSWRDWAGLLGPGLIMAGGAIGGGEWVTGPLNASKFGPWLFWLATCSILGQVIYNIEISRYTLYSGEPIFTGKFRMWPGPWFWLFAYLVLDFGTLLPYLAGSAAQPTAAFLLGHLANTKDVTTPAVVWGYPLSFGQDLFLSEKGLVQSLSYVIFVAAIAPLMVGGRVYNSVKALMTFKVFFVLGFLTILAVLFWDGPMWREIGLGFVNFGGVPVQRDEDLNGNGKLDPGEDWDKDGRLDVREPLSRWAVDTDGDGTPDVFVAKERASLPEESKASLRKQYSIAEPSADLKKDNQAEPRIRPAYDNDFDGKPDEWACEPGEKAPPFKDINGDGGRDGYRVVNVFASLWEGKGMPKIDTTALAILFAMAAISGSGGLTNTTVSAYTREQGWGMGKHVGAVPSMIGGHAIELSHVGMVFKVTKESLKRWKEWYWHIFRDQVVVWAPACFLGLALPSMLSLRFLPRGVEVGNWDAAAMTANGVGEAVGNAYGSSYGPLLVKLTLFCGLLVLWPSLVSTIDGFLRRWVDVLWTAFPAFAKWEPKDIGRLYFSVLLGYMALGIGALTYGEPKQLIEIVGVFYNAALGVSCFHTLATNTYLMPKELQPGWLTKLGLIVTGIFFSAIAVAAAADKLGFL